jgi:hypothetical protein
VHVTAFFSSYARASVDGGSMDGVPCPPMALPVEPRGSDVDTMVLLVVEMDGAVTH